MTEHHTPSEPLTVLLVGQGQSGMGSLRAQLEALGYTLVLCERDVDVPRVLGSRRVDVVIVDVTSPGIEGVRTCRLAKEVPGHDVPVLLATLRADRDTRTRGAEVGADGFLNKPIEADELHTQIGLIHRAFRLTTDLRQENSRAGKLNAQLMSTRSALDMELQLAHRLQESLLPQTLPRFEKVVFAAGLRPSGAVSGDFYDVLRLDEKHVGFYVADAIGHGVPAALLTIFVKKGIQTKDISGNSYRLLTPGEALSRLNDDIIEASLSDNPFVTMFYGCVNIDTLEVTYSTGGHPSPLLLHADGTAEAIDIDGPLLGVFHGDFPVKSVQLVAGDRLVVYSDGVEHAAGPDGQLGIDCVRSLYLEHSGMPLEQQVPLVMDELSCEASGGSLRDDTTMLVLQALA